MLLSKNDNSVPSVMLKTFVVMRVRTLDLDLLTVLGLINNRFYMNAILT